MYGAEQKQYLDANNYNNTKRNHATIVKLIATLKRATTTTDYTYINYYRKTYGEIPLWVFGKCTYVWKLIEHISEVELLNKMGFPKNWKNITRYHLN